MQYDGEPKGAGGGAPRWGEARRQGKDRVTDHEGQDLASMSAPDPLPSYLFPVSPVFPGGFSQRIPLERVP